MSQLPGVFVRRFTWAGKASAPGQIDVHELKRILDTIDVDGVFDDQQHKRVVHKKVPESRTFYIGFVFPVMYLITYKSLRSSLKTFSADSPIPFSA